MRDRSTAGRCASIPVARCATRHQSVANTNPCGTGSPIAAIRMRLWALNPTTFTGGMPSRPLRSYTGSAARRARFRSGTHHLAHHVIVQQQGDVQQSVRGLLEISGGFDDTEHL